MAVLLIAVIGLGYAVLVLFQRTREFPELLAALEREVRELRRLIAAGAPAPATEPVAPAAPLAPTTVPAPEPVAPLASEPSPAHTPPPEAPPPPHEPPVRIDWERWLGIRGAAVLGGIALALAGLLFFKYSVEHGLFPPWLRVVTGVLVGIGAIAAAEWRLRTEFAVTANALAGAGIVVLYASFWAASALYGLVGMTPGFVLMVAVTAACCALAWRHASLVIALLGLVGGFATPLLLSSGSDRPLGLFGYVLLLDLALLVLAQRRRWPMLAHLSLAGTVFYQAVWIGTRMGPSRLGMGLGILGVFTLLFTVVGRLAPPDDRKQWRTTQAAAVLIPFGLVLYLGFDARFPPDLHQVAMLLVLLSAAAGWLARVQGPPELALGAAAASLAVMAVWALVRNAASGPAWQVAMWSCALAAVFHVFVEREPERADRDGPSPPAAVAALGFFALLILAADQGRGMAPWLVGFTGLAGLLLRHGTFPGRERLHWAAALATAIGLTVLRLAHEGAPWFPTPVGYFAILIAAALAFQAVALLPHTPAARHEAEHAAALLPVALLVPLVGMPSVAARPVLFLGSTLLLGLLAALAAMRLGAGPWLLAAMGATAFVHHVWTAQVPAGWPAPLLVRALLMETLAVITFTAWPFLAPRRFRADAYAWPAAALAGPAWFLALRRLYTLRFSDATIGILPLALGALALLTVIRARRVWAADDARRTAGLAWFAAVALSFATVAIPLQLEREWITIGWALEGFAVIVLWTRLDHPGLKYFGVALLGAATARLVANPAVLGYYPRPAWRIVNWLLYTYLVPAAALLGASRVLGRHEIERARPWERGLYERGWPVGAFAAGLAALTLVFIWINLAIADWFATGETLVVSFERLPARDLATSIAWAVYALVLLGIGMARRSIGLRWVSLGLLLVTIAKVFLYDLGELRDLYRVASLLGLAISLMLVSVAYQRFVFRTPPGERN